MQNTIYKTTITRTIIDQRNDPPGWILADPTNNQTTGFFRDKDLQQLIKGKTLTREITHLDGIHGFEFKPLEGGTIGEMRDTQTFSLYPFRQKDEIQINLKLKDNTVTITITLTP